jgi:hypothetical protein
MPCSFDSPQLTSMVGGAQPIFNFNVFDANNFGVAANYITNGQKCIYTAAKSFNPVVHTGILTYPCQLSIGTAATSILCPGLVNNIFPTGTLTLDYSTAFGGLASPDLPVPTTFVVGPSPTPYTDTVYATITSSSAASTTNFASTAIQTLYTSTVKSTSTSAVTQNVAQTATLVVNSCPAPVASVPPSTTTVSASCATTNTVATTVATTR